MKPVRAGRLRHRIKIEEFLIEQDSDGARVEEWVPVFAGYVPAEITPSSGREFLAAQALQSKVNTRIKIRHTPGVTAAMRAVHRSTIYNIEAVLPDADSGIRYLTLLCSTGANEG